MSFKISIPSPSRSACILGSAGFTSLLSLTSADAQIISATQTGSGGNGIGAGGGSLNGQQFLFLGFAFVGNTSQTMVTATARGTIQDTFFGIPAIFSTVNLSRVLAPGDQFSTTLVQTASAGGTFGIGEYRLTVSQSATNVTTARSDVLRYCIHDNGVSTPITDGTGNTPANCPGFVVPPPVVAAAVEEIAPAKAPSRPQEVAVLVEEVPEEEPIVTVIDEEAINQVSTSGLPMNIAAGQAAFGTADGAIRDFNRRLFRLRTRLASGNGAVVINSNRPNQGLSKFLNLLNRNGIDPQTGIGLADAETQPWMNFVTAHPMAGYMHVAVPAVSGVSLSTKEPVVVQDPETIIAGQKWQVFAAADYANLEQTLVRNRGGLESDTWAASIGAEYQVNDKLGLGLGWSHIWNDSHVGNLGSIDTDADAISAYASWFHNNLYADLLYSYADLETDIRRNTGLGSVVNGSPDGESHTVALNLGYNMKAPLFNNSVWGPTVGVDYTTGSLDGYTETGDPRANLLYGDQDFESLITSLGWQISWEKKTNFGTIRPQLRVAWERENQDRDIDSSAALAQTPFTSIQGNNTTRGGNFQTSLEGTTPGTDWLSLGAGFVLEINENVAVIMDYQGNFLQDDAERHFGSIRVQTKF